MAQRHVLASSTTAADHERSHSRRHAHRTSAIGGGRAVCVSISAAHPDLERGQPTCILHVVIAVIHSHVANHRFLRTQHHHQHSDA